MDRRYIPVVAVGILAAAAVAAVLAEKAPPAPTEEDRAPRLAVVWSSADPDVAHGVCLMYAHAAARNKWFREVRLIVWGPSGRLLARDSKVQAKVKAMARDGVKLQACISCANSLGVTDDLRKLGVEVKGMGKPLTDVIRSGWKVITF